MNLTTLDCQHERSVTAICAQILVDLGVLQKFLDNFMAAALASIMQRSTARIILPIHVIVALGDHNNAVFSAFRSGDHEGGHTVFYLPVDRKLGRLNNLTDFVQVVCLDLIG